MIDTKVKTQTVTNTQLATAILAAFLAGGLAFAAAPAANQPTPVAGACVLSQASMVYTRAINKTRNLCPNNRYWGAQFKCTDRRNDTVNVGVGNPCVTQDQIFAMARAKCMDQTHSCVPRAVAPPPVVASSTPSPVVGQPDLVITRLTLTPQENGSVAYQLDYANQGNANANGPFHFSFIAQDANNVELPLTLNEITSNAEYPQENIDGTYLGPKFTKYIFPPLPSGTGSMNGIIPSELIQRGMRTFWVKIDHGERVAESVENNNKANAQIPQPIAAVQNMSLVASWAADNVYGMAGQSPETRIGKFTLSTNANNTADMSIDNISLTVIGEGFGRVGQDHTLRLYKESVNPANLLASAGWQPNNGQNGLGNFPVFGFTPFTMVPGSSKNIIITLDTSDAQVDAYVNTMVRAVKWHNVTTDEISTVIEGTPLPPVTLTF